MTLEDVLQELIEQLGSGGDTTVAWEQVRHWPGGAIGVFQKAGWIKPTVAASSIECPACEESCFMPVHVLPPRNGRASRAYVACDRHDHAGRIKIALSRLRQWQITEAQIARWVSGALGLKGKPERVKATGAFTLGTLQGKKQLASLEFDTADSACLKASGHSLPLRQVVNCEGDQPGINRGAIVDLVDLPPASESKDRYEVSTPRREARKHSDPMKSTVRQTELNVGSPEWRKQTAAVAANARHDRPGGSRDKQRQIREIWASGKYSSRDLCAEEECAALEMSYAAARKALKNTPDS
jgi:hypothetical protein